MRLVLRRQERPDVHARRVVPDEERLAVLLGLVHEVARSLDQHLVEGRHVVLGLRRDVVHVRHVGHVGKGASGPSSTIFCLPILPQRGCTGRVVRVGRPAVDQVARAVPCRGKTGSFGNEYQYGSDMASRWYR